MASPSSVKPAVAVYIVAYTSLSVPAVLAGSAVDRFGLRPTFETFGAIVAVVALIVAVEAWRTRPRRMLVPQNARACA
jgi:protein-S-isoprenylcysteine O-methyltransferase Ste14